MSGEESGMAALSKDVSGRLSKAFEGHERFHRWGKHYLLSLTRSH
jgi:hypothetical protein